MAACWPSSAATTPSSAEGQLYVKLLPDGDPAQLTHDDLLKLGLTFSPDSSRIAYGTAEVWDTWVVPVIGGEPRLWLPNSSTLTWIQGGQKLLFSEVVEGSHMVLVTTDESRGQRRVVYAPPGNRSMVHHAYLSPDGRWVLTVEMDNQGNIGPCHVVPFEGGATARVVGPDGECLGGRGLPTARRYTSRPRPTTFTSGAKRFPKGKPNRLPSGQPRRSA